MKTLAVVVVSVFVLLAVWSMGSNAWWVAKFIIVVVAIIIAVLAPSTLITALVVRAWPQPTITAEALRCAGIVSWLFVVLRYGIPKIELLVRWLGLVKLG